ncbi:MAG: hypothetical protein GVY25_10645, partial [Bacteroidetes bacterium]|nr:hypothetical protein [Bacteroidota bacterium]
MDVTLRRIWLVCVLLVAGLMYPLSATAQPGSPDMAGYYEQSFFLSAPPAAFGDGLYGTANPALAGMIGSGTSFIWSSDGTDAASIQDWGVFSNFGGLSASYARLNRGAFNVNAYHIGVSGGTRSASFGLAYQGFSGDATALGRYNRLVTGTVLRPSRYLSVGAIGNV